MPELPPPNSVPDPGSQADSDSDATEFRDRVWRVFALPAALFLLLGALALLIAFSG